MTQQLQAQVQILDRMMYLLEEGSVQHLMQTDERFADYIDELYGRLEAQSLKLQTTAG